MTTPSETRAGNLPAVEAIAARIGMRYLDKCDIGAPFYAFTPTELTAFAEALAASEPVEAAINVPAAQSVALDPHGRGS